MMTFWGPAKQLIFEPQSNGSILFGSPMVVPESLKNSMRFLKALPEAHFSRPGGKKKAKADFRPSWADSGLPFGPTFGQILYFFEGLHFRQILKFKLGA